MELADWQTWYLDGATCLVVPQFEIKDWENYREARVMRSPCRSVGAHPTDSATISE
jgi:hypothetical protein